MNIGLISLIHKDEHPSPPGHPENAVRMSYAVDELLNSDLVDRIDLIKPKQVSPEAVYRVHDKNYLVRAENIAKGGGGFIDISQNARKSLFVGTFTAGGLKTEIVDGTLKIIQEGKTKKFVKSTSNAKVTTEVYKKMPRWFKKKF